MKYYKYIVIFLSILVLLLGGYIIYMKSTISLLNNDINNNSSIDSGNNNIDSGNNNIDSNNKVLDYNCSFTKTFRFIQKVDYETYVDGTTYIVGDIYQSYEPLLLIVDNDTAGKMERNKYYEFTYTLKGTTNNKINNIDDVLSYFSFNNAIRSDNRLKVLLEVKETDKLGMEQIQEDICKNK